MPDEGLSVALTDDDTGELDVLTGWLGAGSSEPEPRVRSSRPAVPGSLLLCTDGLCGTSRPANALRARLARTAASAAGGTPLDGGRALVRHAFDSGGHDNVTALLLPVSGGLRPWPGAAVEV